MLWVTSSAEYCEQYVAYSCRMSRLLNSPGTAWEKICRLRPSVETNEECKLTPELWVYPQMASRLPGGSEELMRGTATGGALDQGSRSVPVASNTTAPIPNTTVTVTLTCVLGESAAPPLPRGRFHISGV